MKRRVLITCPHLQRHLGRYQELFAQHRIEVDAPAGVGPLDEQELGRIIGEFDGVIAGEDVFSAAVLERAERLKVLVKWGIGVDAIDLVAAKRLGVRVFNTPGVFADEVADVVLAYMILLARQLHRLDREVRAGGWPKHEGVSLRDRTLGIIGLGSIGLAVARRGAALGMRLAGCDTAPVACSFAEEIGLRLGDLDQVIAEADFLSLNCNLTAGNRHLLGKREFGLMRRGVYLINTARGGLIDEAVLAEALTDGTVAGAALDVFEEEPLPARSPLRRFDSCIFGSHNASNTQQAVARVNELAVEVLLAELEALSGRPASGRPEVVSA